MPKPSELLGKNILFFLNRASWSQRDLAAKAGIDATLMSRYIRGLTAPSVDQVNRICEALGTTPARLLATEKESELLDQVPGSQARMLAEEAADRIGELHKLTAWADTKVRESLGRARQPAESHPDPKGPREELHALLDEVGEESVALVHALLADFLRKAGPGAGQVRQRKKGR